MLSNAPRVLLFAIVTLGIGVLAPAEPGGSDRVDEAVAEWAKQRLTPLEGAAAADAAAAFNAHPSTPTAPLARTPKPPETTPNPFRFAEPPAAEPPAAATSSALVKVDSEPRTVPTASQTNPFRAAPFQAEPAPPTQLRSTVEPSGDVSSPPNSNPLRETAAVEPVRSPAINSTAARRAFEPPPTVPADSQPLRLEMEASPVLPIANTEPTPEPRRFAPPARRVASLERPALPLDAPPSFSASAGAPATKQDTWPSQGDVQVSGGTGQPGPAETHGAQRAALIVEKLGPEEARVGQTCRFLVTIRNTGSTTAHGVVLTDETPAGATFERSSPLAEQNGARLRWELGSIAPGAEQTVEMLVTPSREGPVGSVARVSFDALASATTRATRPQLALRVAAEPSVRLGREHRVTVEVHNPGTGVATGVMLREDVPPQVSHPAGPELEFEVGRLAPGETRRLELVLTAEQAGRVENRVRAVADGDLSAEGVVEFDVVAPSIAVKIDGPARRYLERPASYRVSIANPGTADARDVRLVTHLPRGRDFVSANNLGEYDEQTHAVYWSLAELPEGQRGEVEVVALPVAAGDHTIRVESEATGGLRAQESQRVRVEGVASLAFDVRDLQDPIEIGEDAEYDIRVANEGTKSASGVRVVGEAPAGMRFTGARGETSARTGAGRVEFAPLPRLAPGAEARFRVQLRGESPGDHRVPVLVASAAAPQPIRREESTRVFGNE